MALGAVVENNDLLADAVAAEAGEDVDPEVVVDDAADQTFFFFSSCQCLLNKCLWECQEEKGVGKLTCQSL